MSDKRRQLVKPTRDVRESFARVPVFALDDSRLSHIAFRLYAVFTDTVNADDPRQEIWLSRGSMAERCGLSRRSTDGIDKAIAELLDAGYMYLIDETNGRTKRYGLVSRSQVPLTERDLTSGTEREVTSPPDVTSRHNQEPSTKNPHQEPVNYSTGKPARANHTQPPLMQPLQGKDKNAPREEGDPVATPRDLRHQSGDKTTDRVIRFVALLLDAKTRDEAVEWMTDDDGDFDDGSGDSTSIPGTIRSWCHGRHFAYPKLSDAQIRWAIDRTREDGDWDALAGWGEKAVDGPVRPVPDVGVPVGLPDLWTA